MPFKDPEKAKEYQRKYYQENRENILEEKKKYREENIERITAYDRSPERKAAKKISAKKWEEKNRDKRREQDRNRSKTDKRIEWRKKYDEEPTNRENKRELNKKWRKENSEKRRASSKKYYQENKEKVNEYRRKHWLEKYYTDPCYKLRQNVKGSINQALKGGKGGQSFLPYVDWTIQELKEHLENQFEDWMTWENHGVWHPTENRWQIDHVMPQSVLLEGVETMDHPKFRECWALENLRPLEARENLSKGNKILDEE